MSRVLRRTSRYLIAFASCRAELPAFIAGIILHVLTVSRRGDGAVLPAIRVITHRTMEDAMAKYIHLSVGPTSVFVRFVTLPREPTKRWRSKSRWAANLSTYS